MNKSSLRIYLIALIFLISGCAKNGQINEYLPSSEIVNSRWTTYKEAVANYENIVVGMSEEDLIKYGICDGCPNIEIENWFIVKDGLKGSLSEKTENTPAGIIFFLESEPDKSKAFRFDVLFKTSRGEGNFFLYTFDFLRVTKTEGYSFGGKILIVDGIVVYVFPKYGGVISENKVEKNPLGPLQNFFSDFGPKVVGHSL